MMKKCRWVDSVYATAARSHVHLVQANSESGFGRPGARLDFNGGAGVVVTARWVR
jgi:hypothetical protein